MVRNLELFSASHVRKKSGSFLGFYSVFVWRICLIVFNGLYLFHQCIPTLTEQDPVVTMDIKMGYRNKHESPDTWHLLANSTETRTLKCDINSTHHHIDQVGICIREIFRFFSIIKLVFVLV